MPFRVLIHIVFLRPILRLVFGVTVTGRENLKDLNQFILAANHNSHLDVFLLYSILPIRLLGNTSPVAARDYFEKPAWLFAVVEYLFHPIWVDRHHKEGDPLDEMLRRIDDGKNVIIFPEGTRGEPGQIQRFKKGIERLVRGRPSTPVIPVFLHGPERSLPKNAPMPVPLWNHVAVGPPQLFTGSSDDVPLLLKQSIEALAESHSKGRHRRAPDRQQAFTVAVLGIDGSGKSTLSRRLALGLSDSVTSCLISDRLELFEGRRPKAMQPLLTERAREWIGQRAKRAKSLAGYKIPKLTELLLRDRLRSLSNRWYRPSVIVMDGCPLFNMTAFAALYREEYFNEDFCGKAMAFMSAGAEGIEKHDPLLKQFPEVSYLRRLGFDRLNIPDLVIFLDIEPAEAMRRIDSRGEQKQAHETENRLSQLRKAYLLVCAVAERDKRATILRVDGARQLTDVSADAIDFVQQMRDGHGSQ
jgi:1-acyl-sn-glycerol-3-phosphate acyltransferase